MACIATNKSVSDAESARVKEFTTLKSDSEASTKSATDAASSANNAASHAPKIVDEIWQVWDNSTQAYVSTGIKAVGADGITPQIRINSDTKNWETSVDGGVTWADTGISSISTNAEVVQNIDGSNDKVPSNVAAVELLSGMQFTIYEDTSGNIVKKNEYAKITSLNFNGSKDIKKIYALPDTSGLTFATNMFYNLTNLVYINLKDSDFSGVKNADYLFNGAGLTELDMSHTKLTNVNSLKNAFGLPTATVINLTGCSTHNVTNFSECFGNCKKLIEIKGTLDLYSATNTSLMFVFCNKLKEVRFANIIKSIDLTYYNTFSTETLLSAIDALTNLTGFTSQTLTLGSVQLAKLTDVQKKVATDKNWILA
jgi:uncharacterized protein YjbI with pentapeptide repeats